MNKFAGERSGLAYRFSMFVFGEEPDMTRVIGCGTAVMGIISGYALYILWWEQGEKNESGWWFAMAFAAAALMSFIFELLRSAIEGSVHPWSRSRVVSTVIMLAVFELYIIAVHTAAEMHPNIYVGIAGFILGEQFAGNISLGWNLLALGTLWIVVALTIVAKLRKFILGWPYPDSNLNPGDSVGGYLSAIGPDLMRGVWAGFQAGAVWGMVSAISYVFLIRAYILAGWIHTNYQDWTQSLSAHRTNGMPGMLVVLLYVPPYIAGLCAKYFGGFGLLAGVVGVTLVGRALVSEKNRWFATIWPAVSIILVLGSPILADPVARHDLFSLAYLSALIWGVPAMLLGALAPFLRRPAHNSSVWGLVASAAAGVMMIVTLARFFAGTATGTEKWLLVAATTALFLLAFELFRGNWSEEFWLMLALSIGTIVWGTTTLMQKANLFEMHRNAQALIGAPLGAPAQSGGPWDDALREMQGKLQVPFIEGGMFSILPGGTNSLNFTTDPCAEVRGWTPEQRAHFAASIAETAASNRKAALSDSSVVPDYSGRFERFAEREKKAIQDAKSDMPPTAGAQFEEFTKRAKALDAADKTARLWENWAEKKSSSSAFFGYGHVQSTCDADLDAALADLASADAERIAAASRLTELKTQVRQRLPAVSTDLAEARKDLEVSREALQLEQAQRLELTMTSSLGFWVTIGLLAIWRLTEREPE